MRLRWQFPPKKYYRKSFQICTKISTGFLYKCRQVDATVQVGMKQSRQAHASWTTKGQVEGSALEGVTAVSAGSDWCRQREVSTAELFCLSTDYQVHLKRKAECLQQIMAQQLDNYLSSPKNQLGFFFTLHYTQNNSKWIRVLKVKIRLYGIQGEKTQEKRIFVSLD